MECKNEISLLARQLYMKLPFWKRAAYRKWHKSNGWDVNRIYQKCIEEATAMIKDEQSIKENN